MYIRAIQIYALELVNTSKNSQQTIKILNSIQIQLHF